MKKMRDTLSKATIALAIGAGAVGTFGVVAPTEASANSIPKVTIDKNGKVSADGALAKDSKGMSGAWNSFIEKYRFWISGLSGIAAVTMILFFIMNFLKLAAGSSNPQARSQAITGLIFTGLAAAGLGGVAIIVAFFYNALG